MLRIVGQDVGLGIDPTSWDAKKRVQMDDVIDSGARSFYHPPILPGEVNSHTWSFMQPVYARLDINAPYSTGTVTIVGGVVTLASGTWPTWAADGEVEVDGVSYTVSTRDSGTQVTLDSTSVTAAALTTYTLRQVDITMPDLFGGIIGDIYFKETNDVFRYGIQRVEIGRILELRQQETFTTEPVYYAIHPANQTGASGQRWMMSLWPPNDEANVLTFQYTINPYRLTSALPYHMGGQPHAETLTEACLAAAEVRIKGEAGIHSQLFRERLASSISFDRRMSNPGNLGYNGNNRHGLSNDRRGWISERDGIRYADTSAMGYE